PPRSTLFPYTTLFRSGADDDAAAVVAELCEVAVRYAVGSGIRGMHLHERFRAAPREPRGAARARHRVPLIADTARIQYECVRAADRKSTRLNSSHVKI